MFKIQRLRLYLFIGLWLPIALITQPVVLAQEGKVEWGQITSPALENNLIGDPATRSYGIYLPPSYETSPKRYPAIYGLHGYLGSAGGFLGRFKGIMDAMIKNRDIGEMIAVFIDGSNKFGGCWYLSSKTIGDYEVYITNDLVRHIDTNYRTIANVDSRGITGFSMGGYGAMHLALKFPQIFSAVVAQGGVYDFDSDWYKNWASPTANANPKDWAEFGQVLWTTQAVFAISAGVSPNPNKPPFFLDKPYELVDNKPQVVPEKWQQHVDADVVHVDLPRYLKQPVRLNRIRFVHGTGDGTVPVSQARTLDKAMTDLGIDHVYDEIGGGHTFTASMSLQFLSDHLEGVELLDASFAVYARGKLATTWGMIKLGR